MIFAKNFARNYEKKIILGTSDIWSMSCSSQRQSISCMKTVLKLQLMSTSQPNVNLIVGSRGIIDKNY